MENTSIDQPAQLTSNAPQLAAELTRLQSSHLIRKRSTKTEVDSIRSSAGNRFTYADIISTAISIILRGFAVFFNIRLAYDFHLKGETSYFTWTVACILVPLVVTSIIHCYMCYEDGKFDKGPLRSLMTCLLILGSSICLRYLNSLIYAIRCKRAESNGDKESQKRYYKLAVLEESDVSFIRLFECFLESAPQKILQISIVLRQDVEISYLQTIVIVMHFGSMAWCLASYQRYLRYAQEDKYNITFEGIICQLCWHFCISVSRTLSIAFVASIFPFWTLFGCLSHIALFGAYIFAADRPACPKLLLANVLFCFVFGIVYMFTYISTQDGATRYKYFAYYLTCFLENIACIALFAIYAPPSLKSLPVAIYLLCFGAIVFYIFGIIVMIVYYTKFHPQMTARKSKHLMINNN